MSCRRTGARPRWCFFFFSSRRRHTRLQGDWSYVCSSDLRVAERKRSTKETEISVRIDLDGTGSAKVSTGIPFFDHMLEQLGRHGGFDLEVTARGDLEIGRAHV